MNFRKLFLSYYNFCNNPYVHDQYLLLLNSLLVVLKLPSDSSASKTAHSPLPNFALLLMELITPPLIIVGSNFDSDKIFATSEVVVVLP